MGSRAERTECPHRPVSNGWSGGWVGEQVRRPTTWCGYCGKSWPLDMEWAKAIAARSAEGERLLEMVAAADKAGA